MTIELTADDGHRLSAYRAGPEDATRGLVLIQEIFGVNGHIRRLCDHFGALGWAVVAPALFDRAERNVELGYGPDDRARGMALRARVPDAGALADVEAAAAALPAGARKAIIGYCWGGTVAWWGATRTGLFQAAVGYYGGGIAAAREEVPRCPVQLHFGEKDGGIPLSDVEAIRAARPEVEVLVYAGAGHGFACEERDSYSPPNATVAQARTEAFLDSHVAR
ncbi:dienelactone hydrolase family protein [Roseomonas sp. OT10]|uniref:dienelactone hydrolase family protein n=1 Tax=Roseomonas cutis TaxID=2897332 RepID=UPI001E5FCBDD|nr:dienelactone hydrolase family protein [Roseomonas sp. OT10]UFN50890.1 dienelactone hydrolase family protein [Roseomonas sp. OT10]